MSSDSNSGVDAVAQGVLSGDRRSLSKAITLVESRRPEDMVRARALLERLLPHTGNSYRIGVTGAPGVGKSTWIERLGLDLVKEGRRLCVLSIDPTSARSGGSLLGDKTRMAELEKSALAFIRPSPSGLAQGGVGRATAQALLLCEAFGAEYVIVETVGVGQSEHAVRHLVDYLLLLVEPGGGDELQGMKRGILELVDGVAVNKCDGDAVALAERTAQTYTAGLSLLGPGSPRVATLSAKTGAGVGDFWQAIEERRTAWLADGTWALRRSAQRRDLFQWMADHLVLERFYAREDVDHLRTELLTRLERGEIDVVQAVDELAKLLA